MEHSKSLEDYRLTPSLCDEVATEEHMELLEQVKGQLIDFPFSALEEEDNTPGMLDAEWFVNKDAFI